MYMRTSTHISTRMCGCVRVYETYFSVEPLCMDEAATPAG